MRKTPLITPFRVAVVGAGYFGTFHYDAWSRIPESQLVAVCDHDLERAMPLAQKYGAPDAPLATFSDVQQMLATVQPDLVDITTPSGTHRALIEVVAPHVKHIICQKPFCGDTSNAEAAVALCAREDTRLAVHENIRFQPWYREIAKIIDSGILGELYQVSFRLRPGDGQGANAYLERQPYFQTMPRFLVHETAIHWIDTFRYLLGEVTGVSARLKRRNSKIAGEDGSLLVFEFENGTTGLFDGNRLSDHAADNCRLTLGEMWLEGAAGTLRLNGYGEIWLRKFGSTCETQHEFTWNDHLFGGDCVFACNKSIVEAWRDGRDAETEAHAYLTNQHIEDAVYRSAETGTWQDM